MKNSVKNSGFKLAAIRSEIKAQKGTVSQCIKFVCSIADECKGLRKLAPSRREFLTLAGRIYADMGVGETVTTKRCTYIRQCSVDLILRWLVRNQNEIAAIVAEEASKAETKAKASK